MSATVVEELHRVWGGVRVDDVRSVDRALRTGAELNRSPVESIKSGCITYICRPCNLI